MSSFINRLRRRPSHEYAPIQHMEEHFQSAEIIRDTIIGLSGKVEGSLLLWNKTCLHA